LLNLLNLRNPIGTALHCMEKLFTFWVPSS
jgi:hypothetical protein